MSFQEIFKNVADLLFERFCAKYGNIIEMDVVNDFLNRVDDFRMLSEEYVDYLWDYVMDFNLWA